MFLGKTDNLQATLDWLCKRKIWMMGETWQVEYTETNGGNKKTAGELARLITLYQPRHQESSGGEKTEDCYRWISAGPLDALENCPNKRRGSARANILLIAAMSQGIIDQSVCAAICGSQYYFKRIMRMMKNEKEIESVYGSLPHHLHILKKGCEAIEPLVPGAIDMYTDKKTRVRQEQRKTDISVTLYAMQLAGAEIIPSRKPHMTEENGRLTASGINAYAPYEFKQQAKDELRGSRCTGILISPENVFMFYHMGNRNMVYRTTVESRARTILGSISGNRKVHTVILAKSSMQKVILQNAELKTKIAGSGHVDRITPEMNMTFIPTDDWEITEIYMKLLINGSQKIDELTSYIREKERIEVICALPMSLPVLNRLAHNSGKITVLCSETQEPFIRSICPNAVIYPVKNERLTEL